MDKENNVSRILSDSITDNNLADDLISYSNLSAYSTMYSKTTSMVLSRSFNRTIWIYFENQKQKSCRVKG